MAWEQSAQHKLLKTVTPKKLAIMQPTYLPWCGYFDLMDQVDEFLLLDNVAFSKQSFQQRNRIRTQHSLEWLTIPVKTKGHMNQSLKDVELAGDHFLQKHLKALEMNYHKSPFFEDFIGDLREIYTRDYRYLTELTVCLIMWLREALGIETPVKVVSTLCAPELSRAAAELLAKTWYPGPREENAQPGVSRSRIECGTHNIDKVCRLITLCQLTQATHYISPLGAKEYLQDSPNAFEEAGVSLAYQQYEHPNYDQLYKPFIAYASVLDLLLIKGPDALKIIREGRKQNI